MNNYNLPKFKSDDLEMIYWTLNKFLDQYYYDWLILQLERKKMTMEVIQQNIDSFVVNVGEEIMEDCFTLMNWIWDQELAVFCYSWLCRIGFNFKDWDSLDMGKSISSYEKLSYLVLEERVKDMQWIWKQYLSYPEDWLYFVDEVTDNITPYNLQVLPDLFYNIKK